MPITLFFNKTTISIIGIALLCFAVYVVTKGYYVALHNEEITSIKLEHQQAVSKAQTDHQAEINVMNARIQTAQDLLTLKTRDMNNALKQKQNTVINGVNTGSIRLRDKHAASTCPAIKPDDKTDSTSTVGQSDNRGSPGRELSRQTSEDLIGLATDAEQTNIALKSCIQQYNNIKGQLHEQGSN